MNKFVSPVELRQRVLSGREIAIVDVRPGATFADGQIFASRSVPLDSLEIRIEYLVPRPGTPIIVVDDLASRAIGFSAEAAIMRLADMGYVDVRLLRDGFDGWKASGYEIFSGTNVPSKAFGEFVEHTYGTPRISAEELAVRLEKKEPVVILDSRPYDEYVQFHIPGGVDTPGAELVYRVHDLAPDPDQLIVVNCAGRTRSIIGTQSLVNAGIPNRVVALKNGTMGWHLAGFDIEIGGGKMAPHPSAEARKKAADRAADVGSRAGVRTIGLDQLDQWRDERHERTLYILDVRQPDEFAHARVPGSRNAPGGQLVQETDRFVGTLGSRIVLVDDDGVRATMTASWLVQMGWLEVVVLKGGLDGPVETGPVAMTKPAARYAGGTPMSVSDLRKAIDEGRAPFVVDLGPSLEYRQGHVSGAWWTMRPRLRELLSASERPARVVLTSTDGTVARLAAFDVRDVAGTESVFVLDGGTGAWKSAGYPLESGFDRTLSEPIDMWYKPYDHETEIESHMRRYLTWEVGLLEQIERDGMANFRKLVVR